MSSGGCLKNGNSQNDRPRSGEIEHSAQVSEDLATLFLEQLHSDVILIVEGQRLGAHKVLLAARSEFFRALLYGGLKETNQTEIELPDAPLEAFKILLKYIYTGQMSLHTMKDDVIIDTLGLAHQYGFQCLETAITAYLIDNLAVVNVCMMLDTAYLYGLDEMVKVCNEFMDKNASHVIVQSTFLQLSQSTLIKVLQRDSFFAPEVDIFQAVCNWCRINDDKDNLAMKTVRFPLMSVADLLSVVRPAGFIKPDALLDAIAEKTNAKSSTLPHRGQLLFETNVATNWLKAKVITGELTEYLLDGDNCNYDMEKGYARHPITGPGDQGIIVKLARPSIINHIKMLLWDRDLRSYSYFIEVSMDQKDWVRVIDYTQCSCRSWQYLYFEKRVVQYIRIVGTHNTVNKVFHLVSLEANYTEDVPNMLNGFIVPDYNVATLEKSAVVIEGVSRSRNTLLDGNVQGYDWDSGYTCHQLGSGSILIQLGQPYIISSLKLLLWDCDPRSYSYYIESSTNIWEWEMVVDNTRNLCQSWQKIEFSPRPIVFIKIVGTQNTNNEVFHCVHFECPFMEDINEQVSRICKNSKAIKSVSDEDQEQRRRSQPDEEAPEVEVLPAIRDVRMGEEEDAEVV